MRSLDLSDLWKHSLKMGEEVSLNEVGDLFFAVSLFLRSSVYFIFTCGKLAPRLARWLPGLRKLRSSKKFEILQVVLILRDASWKSIIFYQGGKKWRFFFLIFTMKLSSTALSYFNAHSTLNIARIFLYFQTLTQIKHQRSKIWILWEADTFWG